MRWGRGQTYARYAVRLKLLQLKNLTCIGLVANVMRTLCHPMRPATPYNFRRTPGQSAPSWEGVTVTDHVSPCPGLPPDAGAPPGARAASPPGLPPRLGDQAVEGRPVVGRPGRGDPAAAVAGVPLLSQ